MCTGEDIFYIECRHEHGIRISFRCPQIDEKIKEINCPGFSMQGRFEKPGKCPNCSGLERLASRFPDVPRPPKDLDSEDEAFFKYKQKLCSREISRATGKPYTGVQGTMAVQGTVNIQGFGSVAVQGAVAIQGPITVGTGGLDQSPKALGDAQSTTPNTPVKDDGSSFGLDRRSSVDYHTSPEDHGSPVEEYKPEEDTAGEDTAREDTPRTGSTATPQQ